jgi:hypothetical protein
MWQYLWSLTVCVTENEVPGRFAPIPVHPGSFRSDVKQRVKQYIILNTSRKHVNYDKNKVSMNKPYNIQNTNICNAIFYILFLTALLINEGVQNNFFFYYSCVVFINFARKFRLRSLTKVDQNE